MVIPTQSREWSYNQVDGLVRICFTQLSTFVRDYKIYKSQQIAGRAFCTADERTQLRLEENQ